MAATQDLSEWDNDPRLYLFTSLTSGSSQIFTATSRMELILKGNKIPFLAIDVATDEKARKLWGRRAGKRRLPGLVKEGMVIGDFNEVEEWNEFGELKDVIGPVPATATATKTQAPATEPPKAPKSQDDSVMRNLASEAAGIALAAKKSPSPGVTKSKIRSLDGLVPGTPPAEPQEKEKSTLEGMGSNEAASSSSVAVTEPPQTISGAEAAIKSPEMTTTTAASVDLSAFQPRDPTDAVPSAGTPLVPVAALASPRSTPSTATPLDKNTPDIRSDSMAGGAGLAESASDLALADTTSNVANESTAALASTNSSSASLPAGSRRLSHRGSDVHMASTEEIKGVEDAQRIDEGDEAAHETTSAVPVKAAKPESSETVTAPAAADADKASESVQD